MIYHKLQKLLEKQGYENLCEKGDLICGTQRFVFTTGLVVGMNATGYKGRYCYETMSEAKAALKDWDGEGDPSGDWIKYKGEGGERSNPYNREL